MLDANTVIAAALNPNGVPRRAVEVARAEGTIALSEAVYEEIAEVLARPKFTRVLTDDRRREILELLSAAARWVEPTETVRNCRDNKDNCYSARFRRHCPTGTALRGIWPGGVASGVGAGAPGAPSRITPPPW